MTDVLATSQGLVQPAYADNWFATPALPNNLEWAQATQHQQWVNNQISYPQQNPPLPLYFNGAYDTVRDNTTSPPIEDFDPNETYSWTPIAGGKGWGNPSGTASGTSNSSEEVASGSSAAASTSTQGSGQGSGQDGGVTSTTSAAVPAQSSSSGTENGSEQDDCDEL